MVGATIFYLGDYSPHCLLLPSPDVLTPEYHSPSLLPHPDILPQESPPPSKKSPPLWGWVAQKSPRLGHPQSPSRGGEITPTVGGIRGGDLSPLHHFPVRVIFGVLGVITPTLGVDVHPYLIRNPAVISPLLESWNPISSSRSGSNSSYKRFF